MGKSKHNQLSESELELREILNAANNDKNAVEECANSQVAKNVPDDNITAVTMPNNVQENESVDKSDDEKIENMRQELRNLKKALTRRKRNNNILKSELEFSNSERIRLQEIIDKRDAQIVNLSAEIKNLKKKNEKLSKNIVQRDAKIKELESFRFSQPTVSKHQDAFWNTTELIAEIAFFPAKLLSETIKRKINRN